MADTEPGLTTGSTETGGVGTGEIEPGLTTGSAEIERVDTTPMPGDTDTQTPGGTEEEDDGNSVLLVAAIVVPIVTLLVLGAVGAVVGLAVFMRRRRKGYRSDIGALRIVHFHKHL